MCNGLLGLSGPATTPNVVEFLARVCLLAMGPHSGLASSVWRNIAVHDRRTYSEYDVGFLAVYSLPSCMLSL